MFENYQATEKDFQAIEEGIRAVWRPELDFVFKKKNLIKNVVVVSYDSKFIYLWTKLKILNLETIPCHIKEYYTYKIPHKIQLKDEWQYAWCATIWDKEIEKLLPKKIQQATHFEIPRISGGFLTPFIELQKRKSLKYNPYITPESFLATIVHEFGHIYWNQHKLWWYSNKKENLQYLGLAKKLYQNKKVPKIKLQIPTNLGISEVFASCSEYSASELFWPNHKQNFDNFFNKRLTLLVKEEKKKDLNREDSVLEPIRNCHDFASVFGKIILSFYPSSWPQILLKKQTL